MSRKRKYDTLSIGEKLAGITRWIVDILAVVTLALFLSHMVGTRVSMEGSSMLPTLESGQELLINRFSVAFGHIERYDILAYRLSDQENIYLKRVLALPGETVQITDGKVYINGELLDTGDYFSSITAAGIASEPVVLLDDEYFVLGENAASLDSRFADVGNISLTNVLGTVWLRLKPFRQLAYIH